MEARNADEGQLRARLKTHVEQLAGGIGQRNLWQYANLVAAAEYVEAELTRSGHEVASQRFAVDGQEVRNLEVVLPGGDRPDEIVLVGGHYDSVLGSPGANDNATGTAAVLELARLLAGRDLSRTVRLVAFVNEEPPFFRTDDMGSLRYARRCSDRGERICAMLCLETIGYYSTVPGSQAYPLPFGLFHPSTADFVAFVANLSSRRLGRQAAASFRRQSAFPCEASVAPGWLPGVGWSDHWAFWQQGYPAIMVTDTALFRYAHYHMPHDTPDKIDYERTAQVVAGLARVVEELAGKAGT